MTFAQAKMVVWNYETYDHEVVKRAAAYILGSLDASQEDIDQAYYISRYL